MKRIPLFHTMLLGFIALLIGCAAGDPSSSTQMEEKPTEPPTPTEEPATAPKTVAAPSKKATPSVKPEGPTFSHKSSQDTVEWESTNISGVVPVTKETDREWPGERLGLIGPIVAKGGVGSKSYVTVYDSAGVLIGGMTYAEYKKSPDRMTELLQTAQKRSEHQNRMVLQYLIQKRLAAEAASIHRELGGRHENK